VYIRNNFHQKRKNNLKNKSIMVKLSPIQHLKQLKLNQTSAKSPNVPVHALPRPSYSDKTANGLTKCILDWINLNGWQAERINTMGRTIDSRKQVTDVIGRVQTIGSITYIPTTGTKGSADISATIKGQSVKIEVKIKDRQSESQKRYKERIEQSGGEYWLVRSFDEFYKRYHDYMNGFAKE